MSRNKTKEEIIYLKIIDCVFANVLRDYGMDDRQQSPVDIEQ